MPVVSAFYGVVIRMYYKEHEPPHLHGEYAGQHAKFTFNGELIAGEIASRRAVRRIRKWAAQHLADLEANWERMKAGRSLEAIAPLSDTES